jgi:Flp pilus assembly protein TadG
MRMATERRRKNQRGMAIFFYATMLIFVIGCVGLAVDVGTVYMIRARLVAAVDAAALAAGRSVNLTNSVATATTNATNTASQFFAANFPTGYFNSIGSPTVTPTFTQETDGNGNPSGVLDIQVTASVAAPTYFMNIFNVHSITVSDTGTASRRGLVLMLVLDTSSSMGNRNSGSSCDAMVAAAQNFVTLFSPFDQIGLVTFNLTAQLVDTPTASISQVSTDIGNITCGSNTNTISALELAYQQIKAIGKPLALNTIVLFTDGSPNGITANFPARAVVDSRFGPAMNAPDGSQGTVGPAPPAQSGSTYGVANSCNDVGPSTFSANNEAVCVNMPTVCTVASDTIFGTIAQWGNQNSWGGGTYGAVAADNTGSHNVILPGSCNGPPGTNPTYASVLAGTNIRQFIAYIPDTDFYGNNLHGITATGTGPTVVGGLVTRDGWLYQTNQECSPDPTVSPNCKNTGDFWSNHPGVGSGSNFFAAGTAYQNFFRPDQSNTVVAASMNGTMSEAYRIRSDTTYHPVIHSIYLTGNSLDSVDREFLPIVANAAQITPLPYDPQYSSTGTPVNLYANPAYQTSQETGKYLVTSDKNSLTGLFAQLASEVLRLSQ